MLCYVTYFDHLKHIMLQLQEFDDYDEADVINTFKKRVQLQPYKQNLFPYKCIGLVLGQTKNGDIAYSTGFLVSSCLVLTSAHTFCKPGKKQVIKLKPNSFFEFGAKGLNKSKPNFISCFQVSGQYVQILERIVQLKKQKEDLIKSNISQKDLLLQADRIKKRCYELKKQSEKYDYALLKLSEFVQREEYFQLTVVQKSQKVTVCGFCKDKDSYNHIMYYDSSQITINEGMGSHECLTDKGQSGSPVFQNNNNMEVIGIHKAFDRNLFKNTFTLINFQMLKDLQRWIEIWNFTIKKTGFSQERIV